MADNDIFSTDPVEIDLSFNDIVGEDKKYKEPDALAKGYANLERHARTLEAENAAVRAERDALQATKPQNNSETPRQEQSDNADQPRSTPPSTPKPEDFRSQIKDEIRALNEEDRATQNIETTARRLVDVYGSQKAANEAIRTRADELGVSVEWLRDSAATSPSAFYATMNVPSSGGTDRSTPSPNQEIRFLDNRNKKDFEFYDRLRKDNSKLYYSAATQREMLSQAKIMGADFYKR